MVYRQDLHDLTDLKSKMSVYDSIMITMLLSITGGVEGRKEEEMANFFLQKTQSKDTMQS